MQKIPSKMPQTDILRRDFLQNNGNKNGNYIPLYTIIIARKSVKKHFHMKRIYDIHFPSENESKSEISHFNAKHILSIFSSFKNVQVLLQISHIVDGLIPVKAANSDCVIPRSASNFFKLIFIILSLPECV